ncbi:pilus assembly protein TadG-related protein [Xinfangfangia sp. CPCC 101601]|uniref:Pilus assembly protein TadG-related protein n=1 Tax=Pseudogemmobacter lacusdianii TaxID=3069608 RepID=A0ABU0VUE3_9RHOB|nr:pilus assembly protein TadG-related protein [Xinfangfangia sp. CPCC 101601]MDQ2065352.1 pilus assembly protein TadG-related protein [Xinfangfangia sp. CPCC 101601]
MRFRQFMQDSQGAIAVLVLLLFPVLMLVGGLATDISLGNAQKRYVQSQADLAAQSAARYLPDAAKVRERARSVVRANDRYGTITLSDADIVLGSYNRSTREFTPHPNQANPVGSSAVRVQVPSPFRPLLLSPILQDEDLTVRRAAVGVRNDVIVYTLRNSLLSVDTSASILDPLLRNVLGVELAAHVAGYRGLADLEVSVNDLLGLGESVLSAEANVGLVTFNDVLNAPIQLNSLLGLQPLGGALTQRSAGSAPTTLRLLNILHLSPGLAHAQVGDILPDVKINAFDLVTAMLGLAGAQVPDQHRVNVGLGLNLSPLANAALSVGVLSQPVTVVARLTDSPLPSATIEQANVGLRADVLDMNRVGLPKLIELKLALSAIRATAQPTAFNCMATGNQGLADFTVTPSLAGLTLQLEVLKSPDESDEMFEGNILTWALTGLAQIGVDSGVSSPQTLVADPQAVRITANQFAARQPVVVSMTSLLAPLASSITSAVTNLRLRIVLLGGVTGLDAVISSAVNLLSPVILAPLRLLLSPLLNGITSGLLRSLGVRVLPAELVLQDYSCGGALVQ